MKLVGVDNDGSFAVRIGHGIQCAGGAVPLPYNMVGSVRKLQEELFEFVQVDNAATVYNTLEASIPIPVDRSTLTTFMQMNLGKNFRTGGGSPDAMMEELRIWIDLQKDTVGNKRRRIDPNINEENQ